MCLVRKGIEGGVLMCQKQIGKTPCLSPGKRIIFPELALFSTCLFQKFATPIHFRITFLKSARIELPPYKVLFCARSKFWGVSGSEDRGGGDNSI